MPDPDEFSERVLKAIENADMAFWEEIAKAFPEVTSGDFPPEATFQWENAMDTALYHWLMFNHPDSKLIDENYRS